MNKMPLTLYEGTLPSQPTDEELMVQIMEQTDADNGNEKQDEGDNDVERVGKFFTEDCDVDRYKLTAYNSPRPD